MKSLFYCLVGFDILIAQLNVMLGYLRSGGATPMHWTLVIGGSLVVCWIFAVEWRKLK